MRNAYIDYIRRDLKNDFDYLIVLDMDGIVGPLTEIKSVLDALKYLHDDESVAAAFANSFPVCCDIYALRHSTWCATDCWDDFWQLRQHLEAKDAIKIALTDKQIPISSDRSPIFVDSAFGGLGIYKARSIKDARYSSRDHLGSMVCEHIPFNLSIASRGKLAIYPSLMTHAPRLSIISDFQNTKNITLSYENRHAELLVPSDHMLDIFQREFPLYDRRFPRLARLLSDQVRTGAIINVGSNVGDAAAAMKLSGCKMKIKGVEFSSYFYMFSQINKANLADLFDAVSFEWAILGCSIPADKIILNAKTGNIQQNGSTAGHEDCITDPPRRSLRDIAGSDSVKMIKINVNEFDYNAIENDMKFFQEHEPIIWAAAQTSSHEDEEAWRDVISNMTRQWPYIACFDNFGFLYLFGSTKDKKNSVFDFIHYCRMQKEKENSGCGKVRTHYVDIFLFPAWSRDIATKFIGELTEYECNPKSSERWTILKYLQQLAHKRRVPS